MSANAVGIGIPGFGGFVLFAIPDVHLVYNVTPPFLHYEQARAAYQRITLTSVPAAKMTVSRDLLRAMLTDQLAFIAERESTPAPGVPARPPAPSR